MVASILARVVTVSRVRLRLAFTVVLPLLCNSAAVSCTSRPAEAKRVPASPVTYRPATRLMWVLLVLRPPPDALGLFAKRALAKAMPLVLGGGVSMEVLASATWSPVHRRFLQFVFIERVPPDATNLPQLRLVSATAMRQPRVGVKIRRWVAWFTPELS